MNTLVLVAAAAILGGATGYHIVRTEEEQKQLFMAVAHYTLGLGGATVQNWCLRDAQARVFPWGMFYPNQLVPKDVAYVHRNQSLINAGLAQSKGRSGLFWWFASLFFGPLATFLIVISDPVRSAAET